VGSVSHRICAELSDCMACIFPTAASQHSTNASYLVNSVLEV